MNAQRQEQPCAGLPPPPQFMENGWERFMEMLTNEPRSAEQLAKLAFYAGAANFWGHVRDFADDAQFDCDKGAYLTDALLDEVNDYLTEHRMHLEAS